MSAFQSHVTPLTTDHVRQVRLQQAGADLPYAVVIQRWQTDPAFVAAFSQLLANCPFSAYRWETPPLTAATQDRPFEFVFVDAPYLGQRAPDTRSFANQLAAGDAANPVVAFDNLGGDATLVVPAAIAPAPVYVELAAFSRGAPAAQQAALWRAVGAAMTRRLGDRPLWLSTAGGGVAWLHVRLDSRPKYYHYGPYRSAG